MTGNHHQQKTPKSHETRGSRRLCIQLLTAVALYVIWVGFRYAAPSQSAKYSDLLRNVMGESVDLWQACFQLGENLSEGEDAVVSVGNWVERVFLPEANSDESN